MILLRVFYVSSSGIVKTFKVILTGPEAHSSSYWAPPSSCSIRACQQSPRHCRVCHRGACAVYSKVNHHTQELKVQTEIYILYLSIFTISAVTGLNCLLLVYSVQDATNYRTSPKTWYWSDHFCISPGYVPCTWASLTRPSYGTAQLTPSFLFIIMGYLLLYLYCDKALFFGPVSGASS